jgi:hypothetical protein
VVGGAWYAGRKLCALDTKVGLFDTRLTNLEGRVDKAFEGQSPITLLPKGQKILVESGLKQYIDQNRDNLLAECKTANSMANPYDIQTTAFEFFDAMLFDRDFEDRLKTAAFKNGVTIDVVRRVGAIYFRDVCLEKLGFKLEDLDGPKPAQ